MLRPKLISLIPAVLAAALALASKPAGAQFTYNAFKDPTQSSAAAAAGAQDFKAVTETIQGGKIAVGGAASVVVLFKNMGASEVKVGRVTLYPSSNVSANVTLNQCADAPVSGDAQCAVTIAVKGQTAGSFRVDALLEHDGRARVAMASITGEVEASTSQQQEAKGDVELVPGSLDFGISPGGIAQVRTIALKNLTADPIKVADVSLTGPDKSGFSYKSQCPETLQSGEGCTIIVTWLPTSKGLAQGVVVVHHSGKSGMAQAEVKGTLQPPVDTTKASSAGNLDISPGTLDFGTSPGGMALKRSIVLTNHSTDEIDLWDVTMDVPDGSGFTYDSQCPETLSPEENCSVIVTWQPTSKGLAQGVVTVQHSGRGGMVQSEIKGVFTPPADAIKEVTGGFEISPQALDFGNTTGGIALKKSFVLANHTSENITLSKIAMDVPAGSGYSHVSQCPAVLKPQESCVVIVTWQPTTEGLAQGVISVQHSGPSGMVQAEVKGSYQKPLNAPAVSVDNGVVSLSSDSLDFGLADGTIPVVRSLMLSNHTKQAVDVWDVDLNASDQTGFTYDSQCPETLTPEESCNIVVTWTPTTAGLAQGVLTVQHGGKNGVASAEIKGTYRPTAEDKQGKNGQVELTPPQLDFSTSPGGIAVVRSAVLTNNTDAGITIKGVSLDVPDRSGFSYKSECSGALEPGQACNILVTWTPTSRGTAQGILTIQHTGKVGMNSLEVKGTLQQASSKNASVYPDHEPERGLLVSDRDKIDFGGNIKQEAAITSTLVNDGDSPLTLKTIKLAGVDKSLSVSDSGCVPELTLQPGEACPLTVSWKPDHEGAVLDSLQVKHTGARGVLVIPVSGAADKTAGDDRRVGGLGVGATAIHLPATAGAAVPAGDPAAAASNTTSKGSGKSVASMFGGSAGSSGIDMKDMFGGYTVTSHSSTRAVINGPNGGQVVRDGEDLIISGVKCTVTITHTGVVLSSGKDNVMLPFDASLRLLDNATKDAQGNGDGQGQRRGNNGGAASLMPPNLALPPPP